MELKDTVLRLGLDPDLFVTTFQQIKELTPTPAEAESQTSSVVRNSEGERIRVSIEKFSQHFAANVSTEYTAYNSNSDLEGSKSWIVRDDSFIEVASKGVNLEVELEENEAELDVGVSNHYPAA